MPDLAQVGTSCSVAQLNHSGRSPLGGKHLGISKTSPLHLPEPFRVKGLDFLPTVAKVGQGTMNENAMLGRLGCVGHSLTLYTHLGKSTPLHFG